MKTHCLCIDTGRGGQHPAFVVPCAFPWQVLLPGTGSGAGSLHPAFVEPWAPFVQSVAEAPPGFGEVEGLDTETGLRVVAGFAVTVGTGAAFARMITANIPTLGLVFIFELTLEMPASPTPLKAALAQV